MASLGSFIADLEMLLQPLSGRQYVCEVVTYEEVAKLINAANVLPLYCSLDKLSFCVFTPQLGNLEVAKVSLSYRSYKEIGEPSSVDFRTMFFDRIHVIPTRQIPLETELGNLQMAVVWDEAQDRLVRLYNEESELKSKLKALRADIKELETVVSAAVGRF